MPPVRPLQNKTNKQNICSDSTPSLGTSVCHRCIPKTKNQKTVALLKSQTGSSPVVQQVKDPVLSLLCLGLQLWCRFDPWLGNFVFFLNGCTLGMCKFSG